ncbi:toxin-antitoxin system YwqK family antitoxin [Luteolibacter luteus]|uniref:Toxin-antitoxin system YwqK family antitoxin n=1 Tax=Luteolibacter luteus TaxID=2728835 RepID=A0A858RL32_9BACT|nr:hypothetical protein [Luteolibacter luteus]QJE96723.1 hypothetical protein HHL09_13335 [Luteolibacter luteus]
MRHVILALSLMLPALAQELTIDELKDHLATDVEAFDEVSIPADGKPGNLSVRLGEKPVKIQDEVFDGFRFRCPELGEGKDFVWYFNVPKHWGNWYILPVEGKPGQAFKGWLDGDKLYTGFDKAAEKDRLRILQTLTGEYFKPGAEYIMWFRKTGEGDASDLRGTVAFAKKEKGDSWDHDAVEKALALKESPAAEQVEAIGSKGGRILLDKEFFEPGYGEGRIDSMFTSIRQTKRMSGGFFITMQISVPPCTSEPLLSAIEKKYGPPDFVRAATETDKVRKAAGAEGLDEEEKEITRHYYDHFAFETETGAKEPKVLCVSTVGADFSVLKPEPTGSSWASIDIENLVVFHKDGKEVGRAYYFLEDDKKPVFITVPPAGEYRRGKDDVLIAKGKGEWVRESFFPDGKIARRIPFKDDRMHGKAEGFHENGKTKFVAEYRKGVLDGELLQFDKSGKEVSKRKFKEGKPVEE